MARRQLHKRSAHGRPHLTHQEKAGDVDAAVRTLLGEPAVEAHRSLEAARRAAAEVTSPAEAAELRPRLAAAEALGGQMGRALAMVSQLPVQERAPGLQTVALAMATRARGLARYDELRKLDEAVSCLRWALKEADPHGTGEVQATEALTHAQREMIVRDRQRGELLGPRGLGGFMLTVREG
ncbi:MAG: hypothetical protein HY303_20500 [Candidatus Wallbacteria bacterium]|nr:hypothetical protein [Candidatus Wallbacteria bacterium]